MATRTITLRVRIAWWLRWYLSGLQLACWTMGTEPDWDKVHHTVMRAVRIEIS
jgi:hypothetical protein